jgi:DNA-binding LacI/PurR family transcriptional regulator
LAVTIQDIAHYLDLAPSTISKALNDYPHISPKTKNRVLDAARELGYYPSAAARNLRRRRTDRIGFVLSFPAVNIGEFASRLINGTVIAAEKAGYNVMLYPLTGNQLDKLLRICRNQEVDGLLLMGGEHLKQTIELLESETIPFVVLNRRIVEPHVSFVTGDDFKAGLEATRHLIELGHKRIVYMGRTDLQMANIDRLAGYKQALNEADLPLDGNLVISNATGNGSSYQAMRELLTLANSPTAVFAIHDPAAIECLQAITEQGLRVPEDVAIVGFDNTRTSLATKPPLTTIHPPLAEIGRQAMEGLLRQLSDKSFPPIRITLPAKLVIRQSTIADTNLR